MATPWKINIEPEHDVFFFGRWFSFAIGLFLGSSRESSGVYINWLISKKSQSIFRGKLANSYFSGRVEIYPKFGLKSQQKAGYIGYIGPRNLQQDPLNGPLNLSI